jgi:hypothetical protein
VSPSAHNRSAEALMAVAHSILIDKRHIRILRAGASLDYAMDLPERTVDVLLEVSA